ncbi:unnamed protein product [Dibothriocephalus latus]|uniref:Uncharacterized protein n=1 Tax=Dibothriocephalus latus TaxID=60516 RepID=A0A3P7R3T7_DIBLA|nr:unnamed protein product [Dibothriocephalus latus]
MLPIRKLRLIRRDPTTHPKFDDAEILARGDNRVSRELFQWASIIFPSAMTLRPVFVAEYGLVYVDGHSV